MEKIWYCRATRFFPTKEYIIFSNIDTHEIVSLDCGLCGINSGLHYEEADLESIMNISLQTGEQIIVFFENPTENYASRKLEGLEFCGYDLCEASSAITNCGGLFDGVIPISDLNKYGLFTDLQKTYEICELLKLKFPYENHAYCDVYEIWRRL